MVNQKNGASALGVQRVLGLGSYRTAWNWLHKLRRAMVRPGRDRLSGTVEVDEVYIGGERPGARSGGTLANAAWVRASALVPSFWLRVCRLAAVTLTPHLSATAAASAYDGVAVTVNASLSSKARLSC